MDSSNLLLGDCLDELGKLPPKCADLIYLDPPFFSQKEHSLVTRAGDQAFSFSDFWESDRHYADFLLPRLFECKRVLKETGSLFFHCDKNSGHIARFVLDHVFGSSEFRSEIIWYFRRWSNAQKGLLPAHQNILFYSVSENFKFNRVLGDYSPTTNVDQILQKRVRDHRGKATYARDEHGDPITNGAKQGVPLSDVWEMPFLNPKAKERVGYPTQKPLILLERIVQLVTDEGDTVVDPFCGSGTSLVAAKLNKRNYIGIDISKDALDLAERRLESPVKTESDLLAKGKAAYLGKDDDLIDALLAGLEYAKVPRNAGIDCVLKEDIGGVPVLVRIQRSGEALRETALALCNASKNKGTVILVVVETTTGLFERGVELAGLENVHVISSAGISLKGLLENLRRSHVAPRLVS